MALKSIPETICLFLFSLFFVNCSSAQITKSAVEEDAVIQVVENYRKSLENRSLAEMEKTVHEDLLIIEGVHVNQGWKDYRDHHIGAEMKEWESFTTQSTKPLKTTVSDDPNPRRSLRDI